MLTLLTLSRRKASTLTASCSAISYNSDKATGIHLHLGLKKLSGGGYLDPEKWYADHLKKTETSKTSSKYAPGNYKVTKADVLNVRAGAGTKYKKLKFNQLTASARSKILKLTGGKKVDGYVKGMTFTVLEVAVNWGRTPSGWVCLDYCEVLK